MRTDILIAKIVKGIIITALVIGFILVFAYQQTHYKRIGHVVLVRQYSVNNKYAFTDSTGNEYDFWTTDAISPYDTVVVTMFNNCTEEDVEDDMLIDYEVIPVSENEK